MIAIKQKLNYIIEPFKLPVTTKDQKQVLIGSILMKFGLGGFIAFGTFQIYMFSYFYHLDKTVNLALANSISMLSILPLAFFVLFSIKIAEKITYKKLFRICSLVYPFGLFMMIFIKDIYLFIVVCMVVVGIPVGLLVFPSFNCLISYYPQQIGKSTAVLLAVLQISSFLFSILGQFIMNPHNQQANIPYYYDSKDYDDNNNDDKSGLQQEKGQINLFKEDIADNYVKLLFVLGFCCGIFASIGGFYMKNKIEEQELEEQEEQQKQKQNINQQNQPYIQQQKPQNGRKSSLSYEMKEINISNKQDENQQQSDNQQIKRLNSDYIAFDEESLNSDVNQYEEDQYAKKLTVLQALMKKPFIIISFITMMIALYKMFLASNYKTYLLLKINDDQFLTYLNSFSTLFGSIFSILWGYAVDKYSLKKIYILATISYTILTIIFPFCTNSKFLLSISYFAINVVELGIFALIIPALYKFYGKRLAPKLVPFKFLGVILGYIFLPFLSYYVISTGNFDQVFFILGILEFSSVFVAMNIQDSYKLI